MQTPGRAVEPQTPMVPLERRMDSAYERMLLRVQDGTPVERSQIRGLGSVILEMEQLNNNMKSIQSEIQRDIRARRKYFEAEQKLLKKDIDNQSRFQTAALFDLRKVIGLVGFGIAANELAQGDIGGAVQGIGLGTAAFLPEIAQGVIGILAAKGLIGGGLRGGGMVAGGLGMLGGGKAKSILALAALGGLLLTGKALADSSSSDNRRLQTIQATKKQSLLKESDVDRFSSQLTRFNTTLVDIDQTQEKREQSTIQSPDDIDGGSISSMLDDIKPKKGANEKITTEPKSTVVPTSDPEKDTTPTTDIMGGELTDAQIEQIILEAGGRENIMPSAFSDVPGDDIRTDDPELKSALQTIREFEGTDSVDTGYSQFFGDRPGDMKYGDLTEKTIQEIHDLQDVFLKDPQSKFTLKDGTKERSAAVGAGQFVFLKSDAERLLGVDASKQKFTPAFQNQLIEAMAKERGVDLREKLDVEDMNTLGGIFASITPEYGQTTNTAENTLKRYNEFLEFNLDSMLSDKEKKKLDVNKKPNLFERLFGGGKKKNEIVEPVEGKSGGTEPVIINEGGKNTVIPPLPPIPENITGDANVSTIFDGSIDKLESAYALETYAAFG